MITEAPEPMDVVDLHVRLPRANRAEVHFHLEASDGLGYLEQGAEPELGIIHTPPGFVDEVVAWVQAMHETLAIEIIKIEPR